MCGILIRLPNIRKAVTVTAILRSSLRASNVKVNVGIFETTLKMNGLFTKFYQHEYLEEAKDILYYLTPEQQTQPRGASATTVDVAGEDDFTLEALS